MICGCTSQWLFFECTFVSFISIFRQMDSLPVICIVLNRKSDTQRGRREIIQDWQQWPYLMQERNWAFHTAQREASDWPRPSRFRLRVTLREPGGGSVLSAAAAAVSAVCVLSVCQFFFSFQFFSILSIAASCFVAVSRLSSQVVRINHRMHYNILFYNLLIAACCWSQICRCCCREVNTLKWVSGQSSQGSKLNLLAKSLILYENCSQ